MDINTEKKLKELPEEEQKVALEILKQLQETGKSDIYNSLIYQDYNEIPVDITTFLHDRNYLGNALYDQDGRFTLFPYWEKTLKDIFPDNLSTKYNTIIFTGAIGLGKSTIAVICLLYLLYRLLCLKDPYLFYGLQPIDKISISLMNITLENAKGVALDKMNQMILSSNWFMNHGKMTGTSNLNYIPEKHIELIVASSNNQVIGRAIFCLDGETVIKTDIGDLPIKDLVNKKFKVYSVNSKGLIELSNSCTAKKTIDTNEYYEITLDNDTVLKCTYGHKLLLKDYTYKEVQNLTIEDELLDFSSFDTYDLFISNIIKTRGQMKIKQIKKIISDRPNSYYDIINAYPYNNFLIKVDNKYIVSHNCNFTDEVNFGLTSDVEKLKKKQKQLISQIDARMASRFLRGTYLPTLNIIASSKNSEQSFLEDYIEIKKKSKTTLIVDEPQWVVDSRKDSPEKFQVAIGNKFLANELLPYPCVKELIDEYKSKGYRILDVPIGYLEKFEDNIDGALTDIAGIATAASMKYISGQRWKEAKTELYQNPFTKEIISVGTSKDDYQQYSDYFDLTKVSEELKAKPLYIHLDMSKTGDKTGIAGVYVIGKKPKVQNEENSKELFYRLAFNVSIEAPKGYEISFDKHRIFIRWLRSQGFNIKGISSDTYQSASIQQQLAADGFDTKIISVDRLDSQTKVCLPYAYFKSVLYDRRLEIYKDCDFLTEEVLGLERESDGHINHPDNGSKGSKDAIDAVVGSLYNASQHAEEYAYDYGETYDLILNTNPELQTPQELMVSFEEELKKARDFSSQLNQQKRDDPNQVYVIDGSTLIW